MESYFDDETSLLQLDSYELELEFNNTKVGDNEEELSVVMDFLRTTSLFSKSNLLLCPPLNYASS